MLLRRRGHAEAGQGLLLVLAFLAAFLLVIAAALRLASGGFLNLSSVQADTMSTYSLDSGLDYGMSYVGGQEFSSWYTWLTSTSVPNQTVASGSYTFTLDVNTSGCGGAPNDCPTTVTYGYCNGTCASPQAAIATFNFDIVLGGNSILTQTVTGVATTLSGCPCYYAVLVQTTVPSGLSWRLGYNGNVASRQSNIQLPSGQLWLLDPASAVNAADKTLGPQGSTNRNMTFTPPTPCLALAAPPVLTLNYPSSTVTVSITSLTVDPSCTAANVAYDLTISASNTTRTLKAEVTHVAAGWQVTWAAYQ